MELRNLIDGLYKASLIFSSALILGQDALAQAEVPLDPSSVLLLNQGGSLPSTPAIESGRYSPRPKNENRSEAKPTPRKTKEKNSDNSADETPEPVTVVVPNLPTASAPSNPSAGVPVAEQQPQQIIVKCPDPTPKSCRQGSAEFNRRLSYLDLSFAPGYLYNGSESTYSYRRYSSAAPMMSFGVDFWFNPNLSFHGEYDGTLGAQISDSFSSARNVSVSHEWIRAGLRSRKFSAGDGRSTLLFGIDYQDYQLHVPSDSQIREGLHVGGLRLSLEAEFFSRSSHAWFFGASVAPKLRLSESSTAINFQSGGSADVNSVGIVLGQRFPLDRNDSLFWKLSHTIQKEVYSGDATLTDPKTGVAPTGVGVTNSFSIFQIGYSWGS
jgi:hypothetical protein